MKTQTISFDIRENYDNYYDGSSQWRGLAAADSVDHILAACSKYPHGRVLDIGSGEGAVLERLSDIKFCDALYSLEVSKSGLEAIRARKIGSLAEAKLFDGYAVPYEDKAFDLAILSHVVEHLEFPRILLYEAARVARYVFIEVPLEDTMRFKRDYVPGPIGHINPYSYKTIRRLAQTSRLEVLSQALANISYQMYEYQYGRKAALRYLPKEALLRIMPVMAARFFGYNCYLLCRSLA